MGNTRRKEKERGRVEKVERGKQKREVPPEDVKKNKRMMWREDNVRGSGENARETKIKTGNQRTSREERRLFSVLVFQMALHLGLWPPPPLSHCSGDSLSVY